MTHTSDDGRTGATYSVKEELLAHYDREHATTLRVLRAYPTGELDLRPHPKCKTAKELAWVFVLESGLGTAVFRNEFAKLAGGETPGPPESWEALLEGLESGYRSFRELIAATPEADLHDRVQFFTAPGTIGEITRIEWLRFLLHDQIHHRGQFSIYLRMAGGKVPSIYGPTADEPWM